VLIERQDIEGTTLDILRKQKNRGLTPICSSGSACFLTRVSKSS
jgi:hypothetical protein